MPYIKNSKLIFITMKAFFLGCFLSYTFPVSASEDFQTYFHKGGKCYNEGDWDCAIDKLEKASAIKPGNAQVHYGLASSYLHKRADLLNEITAKTLEKQFQEFDFKENTIKIYAKNILNENDPIHKNRITDYQNSFTKELLQKGLKSAKKAIELDKTIGGAHYILGVHFSNVGELDKAEKELLLAIRYNQNDSSAYSVLGSVYEKKELYNYAIACKKKCLELDPEDEISHYHLAVLYLKTSQKEKAMKEYDYLKQTESMYLDTLRPFFQ